jgi:hypothetical protein
LTGCLVGPDRFDSPDGELKQKGITTRLIGAERNCLQILINYFAKDPLGSGELKAKAESQ